ncbi:MAG: PaaI family thioesterase [Candidatus Hermodarchaeota archaeon]
MKKLNPKWLGFALPFINSSPYFKDQNMKLIDLKYGESFLEIDVKRKHLQNYGMVHGGVYAALIDGTGFFAVFSQVDGKNSAATIEMKINYLSSIRSGKIFAHGRCIKLTKNIGLAEATIKNEEGKLLAHGTVTVMVKPPLSFPGQENLPPKFLEE